MHVTLIWFGFGKFWDGRYEQSINSIERDSKMFFWLMVNCILRYPKTEIRNLVVEEFYV